MAATKYNISVEQGATYIQQITLKDATTGVVRNLTGWTGRAMVRAAFDDTVPLATFAVATGGIAGTITLTLTSVQTAAFDFETALYDVEIVQDGTSPEFVERILQGNVFLSKEVTK
jgi:hypothetical protein